jgi:anti-anti-sigma factor
MYGAGRHEKIGYSLGASSYRPSGLYYSVMGKQPAHSCVDVTLAIPVVALSGELDIFNVDTACRVLDAIDGPAIIDLSDVRYLSSAGLAELARVAKRAGAQVVTLANMQRQVLRVLQIVQFDKLFLFDSTGSNGRQERPL